MDHGFRGAHLTRNRRESEKVDRAVADLAHLVETRTWSAIPGNAPLVACLMAILSTLLSRRQSIKEGADYLEQEMLGAILAQVEQIKVSISYHIC